jgi:DNA-binding protein Fis
MHYGAEFGITGASPFLPDWSVHAAFEKGAKRIRANSGYSQIHYFAHLDAAESSDNYTMVIIHLEPILDTKTPEGKPLQQVVVDYMHIWRPNGNYPVDSNEVDTHIVDLATRFKFSQISYDQWGSTASITKLKGYGLNVVKTTFSRNYQNLIFSEMYDLFVNERIEIYNVDTRISKDKQMINLEECTECRRQLLTLQKKWRANNTYKIEALRGNHDDFADCIAAASFEALKFKEYQRLAKPKSVYTGNYFR